MKQSVRSNLLNHDAAVVVMRRRAHIQRRPRAHIPCKGFMYSRNVIRKSSYRENEKLTHTL